MKVLKFGGSSVATPQRIKDVIDIVLKREHSNIALVFSAFGGTTDQLIELATRASSADISYKELFKTIEKRHLDAVKELINVKQQSAILANVKMMMNELEDLLHGIFLLKELSPRSLDFIMSFGERLSAYIITQAFVEREVTAEYLDTRTVVITDNDFGNAKINFVKTNKNIQEYFSNHKNLQIITGFIGATENGETTTIGRSGSDYTAAIFAAALKAEEVEIWTDVDGMMTADPRKVRKAFPIKSLSYYEAMELSHFGAKVIFPSTMQPAMALKIPIRIKNTFNPEFEGTLISSGSNNRSRSASVVTANRVPPSHMITGISSINDVCLMRLEGAGLMGVAGMSMRLFGALAKEKISVVLISQASSEHSICFVVDPKSAEDAKNAIEKEFKYEISSGHIDPVIIEYDKSIIAVVGENMKHHAGTSGRMFSALGKNGVNIAAIAQGSSELNISAVINKHDEVKALNALHEGFFLSDKKSLHVFLVGTGLIGTPLISMIHKQLKKLSQEQRLEIAIVGIANSRKMIFNEDGISFIDWKTGLDKGEPMNMEDYFHKMKTMNLSNSVFVDCTASDVIIPYYEKILRSSISIVTPNKRANSGSYSDYKKLKDAATETGVRLLYETNVGAGLPVINTLSDLMFSGDHILKIEAVLSGTLNFLFSHYEKGKNFSDIVKEAKDKGYTEPDPRDDLSGMDVARKILILGRETGLPLEMKDIKVENLVPENCRKASSVNDFFIELDKSNSIFEKRLAEAERVGGKLRYVASIENGKATVSLQNVNNEHPFYMLKGSDNIVSFTTDRYFNQPLVVKGPGAGAEVTAAGVFADIIRIANYLA